MSDTRAILDERGSRYGDFTSLSSLSQELSSEILSHAEVCCTGTLTPYMKEAIVMICHKLARIANGDPTYIDNWADICGYSQLVVDELSTKEVHES